MRWIIRTRKKLKAAMTADAGMVTNQATTILLATPQRTAEILCPAPTPIMLEETTCVVETGPPTKAAPRITAADEVWAQKAWTDLKRYILEPMVLIIRHPPVAVPKAMAVAQLAITQNGIDRKSVV